MPPFCMHELLIVVFPPCFAVHRQYAREARLLARDRDPVVNATNPRFQFIWEVSGTQQRGVTGALPDSSPSD